MRLETSSGDPSVVCVATNTVRPDNLVIDLQTQVVNRGGAPYLELDAVELYRNSVLTVYARAQLANVVLPRGNRIDFTFSANGNLTDRRHRTTDTATNDPSDLHHQWAFNAGNFVTSYTDPEGNETTYTLNSKGQPTTMTFPLVSGQTSSFTETRTYDSSNGWLTSVTNAEGEKTDTEQSGVLKDDRTKAAAPDVAERYLGV